MTKRAEHSHKDDHYLKSDYKVIRGCENRLKRDTRKAAAGAIAEILKYAATATAQAVKDGYIDLGYGEAKRELREAGRGKRAGKGK